jgi:CHASE3 domain sensor protein
MFFVDKPITLDSAAAFKKAYWDVMTPTQAAAVQMALCAYFRTLEDNVRSAVAEGQGVFVMVQLDDMQALVDALRHLGTEEAADHYAEYLAEFRQQAIRRLTALNDSEVITDSATIVAIMEDELRDD